MRAKARRIVFTGGGTAGHVLPALAVADALVGTGHDRSDITFIGSRRGMEQQLVGKAGYQLKLLPGRGIRRRLALSNVGAIAGMFAAFVKSLALLVRRRPAVVVSVGGYAAFSCSSAALLLRIPVVVINVDAVPGASNRLIGRFAVACATSSAATALPHAVVTGAPLRREVRAVDRSVEGKATARAVLGLGNDRRVVAVVGGSLGAWRLNQAGLGLARSLDLDVLVYHVAGERDFDRVAKMLDCVGLSDAQRARYRLVAFEEHVPELLAVADVVVSRAGAMTIAEIAAIGTPSVLVPLPGAPGDHQEKNAATLAGHDAAVMLADGEALPETVASLVASLLADRGRLEDMSGHARDLGRPDAAEQVAELIDKVLAEHVVASAVVPR